MVDVVFPSMTEKINEWAESAASSYGLSETMAKKYIGLFGSMSESFGFTEQEAYEMSTTLTSLAGDVASFYNITQDEAYTKLKSVFSGETETLKDLGIVMTQSALDDYALASSYGKTVSEMTEAEKVSLRYNFILTQLSNATGDFTRTQDSWANQTRILSLRIDSLKANIGQGLINAFTPLIKTLNSLIEKLTSASEKFKELSQALFGNAANSSTSVSGDLTDAADSISSLSDEASTSSSALDSVADSAEKAKRSVAGFDKLNILTEQDTSDTSASDTTDSTADSNSTLASSLSSAADDFASSLGKGLKTINSIKTALGSVKSAISTIASSWERVWNNGSGEKLLDNINDLLSTVFDNIGDIAQVFENAWKKGGLGDSVIQSYIDKANSLIELIDTISVDFGEVWNDGTGEKIWTNILETIKNCNDYTTTLRKKIKLAWDRNETGKKLWKDILGIVEDITGFVKDISEINLDWIRGLDLSPLAEAVEKLASAFRTLLKACGDKLKSVYKNILLPLAKWTIEDGVPTLVNLLAKAMELLSKAVSTISDDALYAIASGLAAVAAGIVIFKTGTAIASGISKVTKAVKTFTSVVSAHPILAIATAIGAIVTAVNAYNQLKWSNSEAGKFASEIDIIKGQLEKSTAGITENLEDTLETIENLYADNTLIDDYQEKLEELISKAQLTPEEQSQLQTIVTYFSDNVDGFSDTWNSYVQISDDGKVNLTGDLDEVQNAINDTIDEYQRLANSTALSELTVENQKEKISATKERSEIEAEYNEKKRGS
ncbi:MAG: hypothetical protein LUF33_00055 [Clostridiales bacterium]|nr:hypothetical protein [Clostridiales bacterium]